MTNYNQLEPAEKTQIDELVTHFDLNREKYSVFLEQMKALFHGSKALMKYVHSTKSRLKENDHLKEKLAIKLSEQKKLGAPLLISKDNLFEEINDLAGFRILHLHTQQMEKIHPIIIQLLDEAQFKLKEPVTAKWWDDEYKRYFENIGIKTELNRRLYTSVHYVIYSNLKTKLTGEIQVRSLAEELWGEVDHTINYPTPTDNLACSEQILVLARVTSSCTRLVDSIFKTYQEKAKSS